MTGTIDRIRDATIRASNVAELRMFYNRVGFAEVLPDRVTVLAQVAESEDDLDEARAEAGMTRAAEMLQAAPIEIDFERARLSLLKTLQQLQAESRRGGSH